MGANTDFSSLNVHLDESSWKVAELTMAWLLRSGPDDRPSPELATQVPSRENGGISPDGKTITYHLRHDARWSDGVPFTAADVVFSTNAVLNPRNHEITRFFFDAIKNATAPDKYTVVVHLKYPSGAINYSYFYSVASQCILPAHILARLPDINTAPYNALPVGIGPFKYVRWDRANQLIMVANPLYFRGRPKLDRIIVKSLPSALANYGAIRTHSVDLAEWLPFLTAGTENERQFNIIQQRVFEMEYLALNARRPPFDDPEVRRAIRLAIDRGRWRDIQVSEAGLKRGLIYAVTDSPDPIAHPMFDPTLPVVSYNPAAANRLLDQAGWRRGPDGVRVKKGHRLQLFFAGPTEAALVLQFEELLRADFRDVGAELLTQNYVNAYLNDAKGPIQRGNYDMAAGSYSLDGFGDVSANFGCAYFMPNGWNLSRFCSQKLEPLLKEFSGTYEESRRRVIAARIQRLLSSEVPAIYLSSGDRFWITNTDLHGFHPNHSGIYDDFMNVDI